MSETQCWVPHCKAQNKSLNQTLFPLPRDLKYRETWLALTGKKWTSEKQVYFCEWHFRRSALQIVAGKVIGLNPDALPFYGMPQMVCRTCLSTISSTSLFCVVSSTIPSPMPVELMSDLVTCRPEALYRILTFCIPNLNLEHNPPALVCIKCYHHIWQYFVFKLQCNAMEHRFWKNVPLKEYGKRLLCRSCPTTSDTRFFLLNESQPMGQVFKNMFSSNYPTNVVPLKLCLNCWNIVLKLAEFHKQCVMYSGWVRHCENENIPQTTPSALVVTKEKSTENVTEHPEQNPIEIRHDNGPSTSSSSNVPKLNEESSEVQSVTIDSSTEILETELEKPRTEDGGPGNDPFEEIQPFPTLVESELILSHLVKYGKALDPSLDRAVRAKIDLEMWVNVVEAFHNFGITYTLEQIQELWQKMKNAAKTARKTIGPMTYTDYMTNVYLYKVEAIESSPETNVTRPVEPDRPGRDLPSESVETESVKSEKIVVSDEKFSDVPVPQALKMLQRPKNGERPLKKRLGAWESRRDPKLAWTKESKLELVREMRKEYNCLIEKEEELLKGSPWKKIVGRVVSKCPVDSNFSKVYYEWGKMKMSARIHEKDGLDVVDDEVWDLLQLHADVQKSLTKKYAPNKDTKPNRTEITTPPPPKLPKLSSPSPETTVKTSPKLGREKGTRKRAYKHVSEDDKAELLDLFEREFEKMLAKKGTIYKSLTTLCEELKFKNYAKNFVWYIWQTLVKSKNNVSNPLGERTAKLIDIYNEKRVNKAGRPPNKFSCQENDSKTLIKPLKNPSEENEAKPNERTVKTRLSMGELKWDPKIMEESDEESEPEPEKRPLTKQNSLNSDEKKLALIAVLRTFGNEVFKKGDRNTRSVFWSRVNDALRARGYNLSPKEVHNIWNHLQRSAKLTWSQEGRRPRVGDQELIEFMTEVINEKESGSGSKPSPKSDGDDKKDTEQRDEALESVSIKSSSDEEANEAGELDDYSYVSFEDIKKYCEMKNEEKPKTPVAANTVIEILDSDEE